MRLLDELRREGYDIQGAMFMDAEIPTVMSISGNGIQLHVVKNDLSTWMSILQTSRDRRKRKNEVAKLISIMKAVAEEREVAAN